jgi:dTMP kinase
MNKLITFEGVEGSGKSTQIRILGEYLQQCRIPHLLTLEPAGTAIGRKIGDILFNRGHDEMYPQTELLLFLAARAQHVREVILPAFQSGKWVLCDRFSDATFAYQQAGRGLPGDFIQTVNDYCAKQVRPALTLLFDLPVEEGLKRAKRRDNHLADPSVADRFESEKIEFHRRVREKYLSLAQEDAGRFRVIDAFRPIPDIAVDVRNQVMSFIREHA